MLSEFTNKVLKQLGPNIGKLLVVEEITDQSIIDMRMGKCRGTSNTPPCAFYKADTDQCKVCKCFVDVKSKALTNRDPKKGGEIVITHCPLGWWEDREIAEKYLQQ